MITPTMAVHIMSPTLILVRLCSVWMCLICLLDVSLGSQALKDIHRDREVQYPVPPLSSA